MSTAFRPGGVAKRFVKNEARTGNTYDYPRDRLAIVTGYDLNRGTMFATEQETNQKLEVTIQARPASATATAASVVRDASEKKWRGDRIDPLMAESLEPGHWVILERCRGKEKITRGKESILPVAAGWIQNVSEPRPEKIFTGVFTINTYKGRVENIQAWDFEKAIDAQDQEGLAAFGDKLEEIHTAFQNRENPIRLGFQFRILRDIDPEAEKEAAKAENRRPRTEKCEVVDMSYPIDWLQPDADSTEEMGAPPTRADFHNFVNGYIDHIWGTEEGAAEPKEPAFPKEELDRLHFEVTTYRRFKAGDPKYNSRLLIQEPEAGRSPSNLWKLANTYTKFSFGDEAGAGKNWAVRGILQLINDSFDRATSTLTKNTMVRQLFVNGPMANVQSMIASADGSKVAVHKDLDRVRPVYNKDAAPATGADSAGESELQMAGTDHLSGVDSPFGDMDDSAAGFLNPEVASAPAPAPAPESTPAPSEEGTKPGRFNRTRPSV